MDIIDYSDAQLEGFLHYPGPYEFLHNNVGEVLVSTCPTCRFANNDYVDWYSSPLIVVGHTVPDLPPPPTCCTLQPPPELPPVAAVPEPSVSAFLAVGLALALLMGRRRRV